MLTRETATLLPMSNERTQQFESAILEYRQSLARIVATYEMQPALQQELHQEILLAIWQALPRFRGDSGAHTFIYRVAYNQALIHVAKNSRVKVHEGVSDQLPCQLDGPEQQTTQAQSMGRLFIAIRRLPVLQRQLITLSLEGLSYKDIAEITGLGLSNIGVQLNRIKNKLGKSLR